MISDDKLWYNPVGLTEEGDGVMRMRRNLKTAFRETLPVMSGYLVLGAGFGILMKANGFGILWSAAMSVLIYAGSMQYLAVGLLTGGASLVSVAVTTLMINARHLFYGLSMADAYRDAGKRKPYMIFALTDETYSLVCMGDKGNDLCFLISLLDHFYWILGTVLGALIGELLTINTAGIDFALTALFITVAMDQWLQGKDHAPALIGAGASVLCLVLFGPDRFLIPAMAVILTALLARDRKEAAKDE